MGKNVSSFNLFEQNGSFRFEQLSEEAKEKAIENIREGMYEEKYGAYDIAEWVVDDDYLFEPTHKELEEVFGSKYNNDLKDHPMIGNKRKEISYVAKDDRNYYLHCAGALDVNHEEMFFAWLGFSLLFWYDTSYEFLDKGTYTTIEFEFLSDEEDFTPRQMELWEKASDAATHRWETHMSQVLDRITESIESEYSDERIEERIESNDILFDQEGNPLG
jgi:hypothetical protein